VWWRSRWGDIAFDADGAGTVTVRFPKTDQEAEAQVRYLAPFAAAALNGWLDAADIPAGCLFRRVLPTGMVGDKPLTDHEVARIFKRLARRVGVGGARRGGDCGAFDANRRRSRSRRSWL
jgi:hypothetical protein